MRVDARVDDLLDDCADQDQREADPEDGEARRQQKPPRLTADGALEGEIEHVAPTDQRRVAKTEKAERRLRQNRRGNVEHRLGDDDRHAPAAECGAG